jgi:hypothetical protein
MFDVRVSKGLFFENQRRKIRLLNLFRLKRPHERFFKNAPIIGSTLGHRPSTWAIVASRNGSRNAETDWHARIP